MPNFLKLSSVDSAMQLFWQNLGSPSVRKEMIPTKSACNRFLTTAVTAKEYLPAFTRSSMDGFALKAADSQGASEGMPSFFMVTGEVPMGEKPSFQIHKGEAALIHTGGMLPEGTDAVVPLENSLLIDENNLEVYIPVAVNENVILKGEDIKPGDEVIPMGKQIRPEEIGGLLALGMTQVEVSQRPRIAILSSGDEVVPPENDPQIGQVRDINTWALAALIEKFEGEVLTYPIIPDRYEMMLQEIRRAYLDADAVIITAGSSTSARDMTARAISELGQPGILVHGLQIRPGKPTILAMCDGKPVIGLPGNPVSALVIAHLFVKPLIWRLQGMKGDPITASIPAKLTVNVSSVSGREDWIPARLRQLDGIFYAEPIFFKSNLIFQLSQADGLIKISADANGVSAGRMVDVFLL